MTVMEESGELQLEESKAFMEKNKKRRLKTPAQVMALEKFYDDHKYPTEEMKSELAEELGLTEKQVSGWFCHRRLKDKRLLKDETFANGRQDRSSGVIQDHVSGLGQDSCGSTKHGDYRHLDLKEVESHGLYGNDFSVADMTYGRSRHYNEDVGGMDNTSSESSSSLQDQLFSQGQDPYNMEPSNRALPPSVPKAAINVGYKPSGYLKVKGEIENAAITAVKKQLGRNHREDGPLLGVEFDPVPPGAFECQIADPLGESFQTVNPSLASPPGISAVKRQHALNSRGDSKYSPHDLDMEVGDMGSLYDTDLMDKKPRKPGQTFQRFTNRFPRRNSSLELYEDPAGEVPAYNTMGSKHGERMGSDSASNHSDHFKGDLVVKQTDSLMHCYDNVIPKKIQRSEHAKSKPSNSLKKSRISLDTEERGLSSRIAKEEKFSGGRKARKQYHDSERTRILPNETMIAKRVKDDLPQQHNLKTLVAEMQPQKSRRSATEIISSLGETAETSSSLN